MSPLSRRRRSRWVDDGPGCQRSACDGGYGASIARPRRCAFCAGTSCADSPALESPSPLRRGRRAGDDAACGTGRVLSHRSRHSGHRARTSVARRRDRYAEFGIATTPSSISKTPSTPPTGPTPPPPRRSSKSTAIGCAMSLMGSTASFGRWCICARSIRATSASHRCWATSVATATAWVTLMPRLGDCPSAPASWRRRARRWSPNGSSARACDGGCVAGKPFSPCARSFKAADSTTRGLCSRDRIEHRCRVLTMWCPFAVQAFTSNDQFRGHTRQDLLELHGTKCSCSGPFIAVRP